MSSVIGSPDTPDERSRALLEQRAQQGGRPMCEAPLMETRAAQWAWTAWMGDPAPREAVLDTYVPSLSGEVPVRVHVPPRRPGEEPGPRPALVVLHGGCWIVGNIHVADRPHRALAAATGCVVVAVNYQKAPEHRFPVPLQDATAGYRWTLEHADQLGIDPARIGVAGDSAGGNLAAAISLLARDSDLPLPAVQLLVYPALDWRLDTPSADLFAEGYGLTTADMRWAWQQYVSDPGQLHDQLVSPAMAATLSGLPPTVMVTAGVDVLRDEGVAYAERLVADGVACQHLHYPGALHGFWWTGAAVDACDAMLADLGPALSRVWG